MTVKHNEYLRRAESGGTNLEPDPPLTGQVFNGLLQHWEKLGFGGWDDKAGGVGIG